MIFKLSFPLKPAPKKPAIPLITPPLALLSALRLLSFAMQPGSALGSPAAPCRGDSLALTHPSEPSAPPRPINLATRASPMTIIPCPTGSTLVSRWSTISSDFRAFSCTSSLISLGSVRLLLPSGTTSVLTHIVVTSVLQHTGSTLATHHHVSILIS